jgi:hypothetical protein
MSRTALLLISDGRNDYLEETVASAVRHLPDEVLATLIQVDDAAHHLGFAGAIQEGWSRVLATDADYVLHLEQDFTFRRDVPVDAMLDVLARHPHLVQIALLRQPWNPQERRAGGIVQQHPDAYQQVTAGGVAWLEHRRCFTTNPCLYPRWIAERGWPDGPESEGRFSIDLFAADPARRAAYWGRGEEWVTHLGDARAGWGY